MLAMRRHVQIIDIQDGQAFVSGSVDNGEAVIVQGAHKIVPGQPVNVTQVEKSMEVGDAKTR